MKGQCHLIVEGSLLSYSRKMSHLLLDLIGPDPLLFPSFLVHSHRENYALHKRD